MLTVFKKENYSFSHFAKLVFLTKTWEELLFRCIIPKMSFKKIVKTRTCHFIPNFLLRDQVSSLSRSPPSQPDYPCTNLVFGTSAQHMKIIVIDVSFVLYFSTHYLKAPFVFDLSTQVQIQLGDQQSITNTRQALWNTKKNIFLTLPSLNSG